MPSINFKYSGHLVVDRISLLHELQNYHHLVRQKWIRGEASSLRQIKIK